MTRAQPRVDLVQRAVKDVQELVRVHVRGVPGDVGDGRDVQRGVVRADHPDALQTPHQRTAHRAGEASCPPPPVGRGSHFRAAPPATTRWEDCDGEQRRSLMRVSRLSSGREKYEKLFCQEFRPSRDERNESRVASAAAPYDCESTFSVICVFRQ